MAAVSEQQIGTWDLRPEEPLAPRPAINLNSQNVPSSFLPYCASEGLKTQIYSYVFFFLAYTKFEPTFVNWEICLSWEIHKNS